MSDNENGIFDSDDEEEVFIDKTAEFENHVAPLITQIMETCREHGVPVIVMAVYAHSGMDEAEGFGMAGGVAGTMHHMPLPMLAAAGMIEDQVRTVLEDARRTFITAALTGETETAEGPHTNSLWRHALAAEMIEKSDPARCEQSLNRRIAIVMDAFEGLANIRPDTNIDNDSGIDIRKD
jgi:hypothetical protein